MPQYTSCLKNVVLWALPPQMAHYKDYPPPPHLTRACHPLGDVRCDVVACEQAPKWALGRTKEEIRERSEPSGQANERLYRIISSRCPRDVAIQYSRHYFGDFKGSKKKLEDFSGVFDNHYGTKQGRYDAKITLTAWLINCTLFDLFALERCLRSGGFECEMGHFHEFFPQIHHNKV